MAFAKGGAFKGTVGTVVGYIAGNFTKQVSDLAIFYAGAGGMFVGILWYVDWIKIQWNHIIDDCKHAVVGAKEWAGHHKIMNFMTQTLPLMGGLTYGFWYGFEHG